MVKRLQQNSLLPASDIFKQEHRIPKDSPIASRDAAGNGNDLLAAAKVKEDLLKSNIKPIAPWSPLPIVHPSDINRSSRRVVPSFQALLVRSPSSYRSYLNDESKVVFLHVGGNIFTTSVFVLTSRTSHLSDFVKAISNTSSGVKHPAAHSDNTSSPSVLSAYSQTSERSARAPQLLKKPEALSVSLHLPSSPIKSLRSARATIFEDVPSDEEEQQDEWEKAQAHLAVPHLQIPRMSASIAGNSSFLDTTPDEELDDPFHFSRRAASLPSSQPPSLSSSPASSAFNIDTSAALLAQLSGPRPFDVIGQHDSTTEKGIEIHLDRSSQPYENPALSP